MKYNRVLANHLWVLCRNIVTDEHELKIVPLRILISASCTALWLCSAKNSSKCSEVSVPDQSGCFPCAALDAELSGATPACCMVFLLPGVGVSECGACHEEAAGARTCLGAFEPGSRGSFCWTQGEWCSREMLGEGDAYHFTKQWHKRSRAATQLLIRQGTLGLKQCSKKQRRTNLVECRSGMRF